jgi:hypothetical protein
MKKYLFFIFTVINILHACTILTCPCPFSPHDERPFFEQYEIEIKTGNSQTKENKS